MLTLELGGARNPCLKVMKVPDHHLANILHIDACPLWLIYTIPYLLEEVIGDINTLLVLVRRHTSSGLTYIFEASNFGLELTGREALPSYLADYSR